MAINEIIDGSMKFGGPDLTATLNTAINARFTEMDSRTVLIDNLGN